MLKIRFLYFNILLIALFCALPGLHAQQVVNWQEPYIQPDSNFMWLRAEGCYHSDEHGLPVLLLNLALEQPSSVAQMTDPVFAPLDSLEKVALTFANTGAIADTIAIHTSFLDISKDITHQLSLLPLRRNPETGEIEKLLSFRIKAITSKNNIAHIPAKSRLNYAGTSALASGDWYRMSVEDNGIYKLTYNDLLDMGVSASGLSSASIRVHGYGGGMLPERVGTPRHDDLPEVATMMFDGGDGTFDPGDYLLFYAQGPTGWRFIENSGIYNHIKHLYTDYSYYFVGIGAGSAGRMTEFPQPQSASVVVNDFDWYYALHPDKYILVKSGKEWFGDFFDIVTERTYPLPSFSPVASSEAHIRLSVAARSTSATNFTLKAGDKTFTNFVAPIITEPNTEYARMSTQIHTLALVTILDKVVLKYNKSLSSSIGWLNFLEVNAPAKLNFTGGMMQFRKSGVSGTVSYNFTGNGILSQLWDVTNPLQPGYILPVSSGSGFTFKALADVTREYVVADNASFLKPVFVEKVANQNLHGISPHEMTIIVHPDFADEAQRLAEFHASHNNLSVLVVEPQTIYNEFSSGAQDISAMRDFMAMMWNKAQEWNKPRFLLLFGDASYDYKDILPSPNTNFVPTFQSVESLHPVNSYATDDFFGCFDEGEGGLSQDVVDIGIGRLVVKTPEEAKNAVDKIIHYATETTKVHGDWRNVIAFVADDGESNEHMRQADQLATMIDTTYRNYNTEKIFLDAYPQISTPGGQRVPDANLAINQRVGKGAMLINYTGHGGESGWTHEQVLELSDIRGWTNYDRLPVFMTATCEFSRYDDPLMVSGGELVFLSTKGGGVALFTTARPTFGWPNFTLAMNFYNIALKPTDKGMPYLGDLIRIAKQLSGSTNNGKKFVLLGDPALKMAYPEFTVYTTSINGNAVSYTSDTLNALSEVTIQGFVGDENGMPLTDFNGIVTPTIFDKESLVETLGSDGASRMIFSVRKSIIYKGNARVENGHFSISFIVPRDIAYQYGTGKISYYATDGKRDASGNFNRIVVGGISDNLIADNEGPDIRVFINDTLFKSGGVTDANPILLAYLRDESGINTIGSSIGHDIVAVLDDKTDAPFILNDYYQADLDTYKSGQVTFPMKGLERGKHTLKLKLWDVNNNSSAATIDFVVASSENLVLDALEAYPNPFKENARFVFSHNKAGEELELELGIYTLTGKLVTTLRQTIFAGGFRTVAFEWDGRSMSGNYVASGLYIARLKVRDTSGNESFKSVKVSLIR